MAVIALMAQFAVPITTDSPKVAKSPMIMRQALVQFRLGGSGLF
jgi:hypothetical protein